MTVVDDPVNEEDEKVTLTLGVKALTLTEENLLRERHQALRDCRNAAVSGGRMHTFTIPDDDEPTTYFYEENPPMQIRVQKLRLYLRSTMKKVSLE